MRVEIYYVGIKVFGVGCFFVEGANGLHEPHASHKR